MRISSPFSRFNLATSEACCKFVFTGEAARVCQLPEAPVHRAWLTWPMNPSCRQCAHIIAPWLCPALTVGPWCSTQCCSAALGAAPEHPW
jgi:hypothetical protein